MRGPYQKGHSVMYWQRKTKANRQEAGRWHGPATVVGQEGLSIVWVSHADRLIRCAPESLRPASLREWNRQANLDDSLPPSNHNRHDDVQSQERHHEFPNPEDFNPNEYSPTPPGPGPSTPTPINPSINLQPESEVCPEGEIEVPNLGENSSQYTACNLAS